MKALKAILLILLLSASPLSLAKKVTSSPKARSEKSKRQEAPKSLNVGDKVGIIALTSSPSNFITSTRCSVYRSAIGTVVDLYSFGLNRTKTERQESPCEEGTLVDVIFDDQGKCADTFVIPSNMCKDLLAEEIGTVDYLGIERQGLFGITFKD